MMNRYLFGSLRERGFFGVTSTFVFWSYCAGLLLLLSGCVGGGDEPDLPSPTGEDDFTILIYMGGDNTMAKEIDYSINSIKEGAKWGNGNVVIYLDRPNAAPRLLKITKEGVDVEVKTYENSNSGSTQALMEALMDTKMLYPEQKYGLVIWSHGDGWLPWRSLRSVVVDLGAGSAIDIDQMAEGLEDGGLEFIWMDACFMGSVEVMYELRHKAKYLIASPTEVPMAGDWDASGVPYHKVLPYLFGGEASLKMACEIFLKHYMEKPKGSTLQSASITLVDTSGLETLHRETSLLLGGRIEQLATLDLKALQAYHRPDYARQLYYDLGDVVKAMSGATPNWQNALNDCVIYKGATPRFTQSTKPGSESYVELDPERFCGLSCYLPLPDERDSNQQVYYFTALSWSTIWCNY